MSRVVKVYRSSAPPLAESAVQPAERIGGHDEAVLKGQPAMPQAYSGVRDEARERIQGVP